MRQGPAAPHGFMCLPSSFSTRGPLRGERHAFTQFSCLSVKNLIFSKCYSRDWSLLSLHMYNPINGIPQASAQGVTFTGKWNPAYYITGKSILSVCLDSLSSINKRDLLHKKNAFLLHSKCQIQSSFLFAHLDSGHIVHCVIYCDESHMPVQHRCRGRPKCFF